MNGIVKRVSVTLYCLFRDNLSKNRVNVSMYQDFKLTNKKLTPLRRIGPVSVDAVLKQIPLNESQV